MKSIEQWLSEYEESHTHPVNVLIHKVCVPSIMFSILGLLWLIPIGFYGLNFAHVFAASAMIFYAKLSLILCLGILLEVAIMFACIWSIQQAEFPLLGICLAIFFTGWVFQFIGHKIEGKKPSFLQDIFFLLIGPLWTLHLLYKNIGIKI